MRQKGTELTIKEEDKEHQHLPLLVVQLRQGTAFLLSSRLDYAVKAAAVNISLQRSISVKGLPRTDY